MTIAWCCIALISFTVGAFVGRFERADMRIERQSPMTVTPSLKQLRMWRSDRR